MNLLGQWFGTDCIIRDATEEGMIEWKRDEYN